MKTVLSKQLFRIVEFHFESGMFETKLMRPISNGREKKWFSLHEKLLAAAMPFGGFSQFVSRVPSIIQQSNWSLKTPKNSIIDPFKLSLSP